MVACRCPVLRSCSNVDCCNSCSASLFLAYNWVKTWYCDSFGHLERQELSCMYLAHHELESVVIIVITGVTTTIFMIIIIIIYSAMPPGQPHAGAFMESRHGLSNSRLHYACHAFGRKYNSRRSSWCLLRSLANMLPLPAELNTVGTLRWTVWSIISH